MTLAIVAKLTTQQHPYLFHCPLEASHNTILDLIKVLHSLGDIDQHVGTISVRPEAPDLSCFTDVPLILVSKVTGTSLDLLASCNVTLLNVLCKALFEGAGLHEQTVVLVG